MRSTGGEDADIPDRRIAATHDGDTTIAFDIIDDPAAYRLPELMFRRPADADDLGEPEDVVAPKQ